MRAREFHNVTNEPSVQTAACEGDGVIACWDCGAEVRFECSALESVKAETLICSDSDTTAVVRYVRDDGRRCHKCGGARIAAWLWDLKEI